MKGPYLKSPDCRIQHDVIRSFYPPTPLLKTGCCVTKIGFKLSCGRNNLGTEARSLQWANSRLKWDETKGGPERRKTSRKLCLPSEITFWGRRKRKGQPLSTRTWAASSEATDGVRQQIENLQLSFAITEGTVTLAISLEEVVREIQTALFWQPCHANGNGTVDRRYTRTCWWEGWDVSLIDEKQ